MEAIISYYLWENVHYVKNVHTLRLKWEGCLPFMSYIVLACGFSASLCISISLCLLTASSAFSLFLASSTWVDNFSSFQFQPPLLCFLVQTPGEELACLTHLFALDHARQDGPGVGPSALVSHCMVILGRKSSVASPGDLFKMMHACGRKGMKWLISSWRFNIYPHSDLKES